LEPASASRFRRAKQPPSLVQHRGRPRTPSESSLASHVRIHKSHSA
jgi:hypothetical protein